MERLSSVGEVEVMEERANASALLMGMGGRSSLDKFLEDDPARASRIKRRLRWSDARRRATEARHARVHSAIVAAVGERDWKWFERRLHDDCGDS